MAELGASIFSQWIIKVVESADWNAASAFNFRAKRAFHDLAGEPLSRSLSEAVASAALGMQQ